MIAVIVANTNTIDFFVFVNTVFIFTSVDRRAADGPRSNPRLLSLQNYSCNEPIDLLSQEQFFDEGSIAIFLVS